MTQMMHQSLEQRLDSLGLQAIAEAEAAVPPMFLSAVHERDAARRGFRLTIAASAAACFLLVGVTAYIALPVHPVRAASPMMAGSSQPGQAALKIDDNQSRPSLGSLTGRLVADPSAPLPSTASTGIDPDHVPRVGDRADSPVTRDLKDEPPPP